MIQIAAGILMILGGVGLVAYGAANYLADSAMVRIHTAKPITVQRADGEESLASGEWFRLAPGSTFTIGEEAE